MRTTSIGLLILALIVVVLRIHEYHELVKILSVTGIIIGLSALIFSKTKYYKTTHIISTTKITIEVNKSE